MGNYNNKTYPLRINNELRLKIEYIANLEDRKLSQQYERIIKAYIEQYEITNGKLIVEEDGRVYPADHKSKVPQSNSRTG